MRHIFVDESGSLSFGPLDNKFFVLALVTPQSGKALNKTIKNFNGHLIRNGWNPSVEIKASNLWHASNHPSIPNTYLYKAQRETPMHFVLEQISSLDLYVEYAVVRLDTLKPSLKAIPNSILYNYFAWQLLKGPLCYFPEVELFMDKRNREYHSLLKFDGYIEGQAVIERAESSKPKLNLTIRHYGWHSARALAGAERAGVEFGIRGIEAADFVCWAIKSHFENNDPRWLDLFRNRKKVRWTQHLYFTP